MKKFLVMAVFAVGIFLLNFAQASASEVYAYTEARRNYAIDHYVVTNTAQYTDYGLKVQLHAIGVKNDSTNKYWEVGFTTRGDNVYIIWLPSTATTLIADANSIIEPDYFKILQIIADELTNRR